MEDQIPKIIEKEFNAKILEINKITEGYSHFMYLVKIDKEPFEIIIRFSNNNKNKSHNLGKEKYVMDLLRENNIPIPKIYAFEETYMILEKLNGTRLDTIWESLTQEEKIQVTEEIGKLLSKIHTIKLSHFGDIEEGGSIYSDLSDSFKFKKIQETITFNPFIRETLVTGGKDFSRLIAYRHLTPEFVGEFIKYLYSNLDYIDYKGEPVLTHGDYHIGHIFIEKENNKFKIIGLIDFEFARAFPPEYDLLKLHRLGFFENENLKNALIKGYGEINEKAIELHRLIRDMGFAQVKLESGDKEISDKVLRNLAEKINFKGKIFLNE